MAAMKKLLRYWWVVVIGLVVLPPLAVFAIFEADPNFETRWVRLPAGEYRFGREDMACLSRCGDQFNFGSFCVQRLDRPVLIRER